MIRGLKRCRLEKIFVVGATLSAALNIAMAYYIHRRFIGPGFPFNDVDGPVAIVKKENAAHDFSIAVYRDRDIVSNSIQGLGGWESTQISALNSYFQDYSREHNIPLSDLTFIDIGANVGWYTLNMAALGVKVLAFEPMQDNINLLKRSLALTHNIQSGVSGRVTIYEHGLGVKDEMCFLYSDNGNVGDGHVQCAEKETDVIMEANYALRGRVPLKRLDNVLNAEQAEGMNVVAIKIDTEGYEGHVLEGGPKVLLEGGAQVILTEFVPKNIVKKGGDPEQFMKRMFTAGFVAKKDQWGYTYWNDTDMVNMTNFGEEMVMLHNAEQREKTKAKEVEWDKNNSPYDREMGKYGYNGFGVDDFQSMNYTDYKTDYNETTINLMNEGTAFTMELYAENDIVSTAIKSFGWNTETVSILTEYFMGYSKKHKIPLSDLTFIDIGANIGWLTMNMAALGVKVLAFEPMKENINLIKKTLNYTKNVESGISDRITLYEHGLGVKDQTCYIYSDNDNFGDGHVKCVEKEINLNMQENYSLRGKVPLKRLDDVIKAEGLHVPVVFMDTEGYEGNVLEGATKFLLGGSVDMIITEFVPDWVTEKGGNPVEFMKKMTDAGYRMRKKPEGYMKKRDMMNMTNYDGGDVTFHSRNLVKEYMGDE